MIAEDERRLRRARWLAGGLASAGLLLAALSGWSGWRSTGEAGEAAAVALREGNRLARAGRHQEAMAAYAGGWPDDGAAAGADAAVLAYNLGTTAHRLGRLGEAVLWYRRAAAAQLDDPWLRDNLELARAEAGATRLPPPGLIGELARRAAWLSAAAVGLAWAALLLLVAGGRGGRRWRWAWAWPGGGALALWAGAAALAAWGPRPAVLLDACSSPGGTLPAASEVWVGRVEDGLRPVLGGPGPLVCPERALALVAGGGFPSSGTVR